MPQHQMGHRSYCQSWHSSGDDYVPAKKTPHLPNYISRTIATVNCRKIKVLQELTRTVYASFVFLLFESTNILITIVTKKPNNSFNCQYLNVEFTDFSQLERYYET